MFPRAVQPFDQNGCVLIITVDLEKVNLPIIRCLVVIYFLWLLDNYNETYGAIYEVIYVIYEVIDANSGASLGPLWAVKVARNIE